MNDCCLATDNTDNSGKVDVVLYVVHLLGTGHLRRIAALANQLAINGITVKVISGGMQLPMLQLHASVRFVQLPGVRVRDGNFSDLVDQFDQPVEKAFWQHRRQLLVQQWRDSQARVLVIESYPFARRQLRHEIISLLKLAHGRARIVCSVRDILQPKMKSDRVLETTRIANHFYSDIFVHGDKQIATLEETFSGCENLRAKIRYTGYIDTLTEDLAASAERRNVWVAAGGGAVGDALYRASVQAAINTSQLQWGILVGHGIDDSAFQALVQRAGPNVSVQRNRHDYRALLKSAQVSVSQAGYNTVVDLFRCNTAAVLVPYAASGEKEQTIRAQKLAQRNLAVVVRESQLSAESLAKAVYQARDLSEARDAAIDCSGAQVSAKFIGRMFDSSI